MTSAGFRNFLRDRVQAVWRPTTAGTTTGTTTTMMTTTTASEASTTLRLLVLPYAATRQTMATTHRRTTTPTTTTTRTKISYMLYPVTLSKPNASLARRSVEEVLGLWRNGLWTLGRMYRALWNLAFYRESNYRVVDAAGDSGYTGSPSPNRSPTRTPSHPSWLDRQRKKIFDASDRVVSRWLPTAEEEFLRQVNTHGQFVHFGRNANIPIQKVSPWGSGRVAVVSRDSIPIPVDSLSSVTPVTPCLL